MELINGILSHGERVLLTELPPTAQLVPDARGVGAFVRFTTDAPSDRWETGAGSVPDVARWTACHRYEPFWMLPKAGTDLADVPKETQYLLCEHTDGTVTLVVPLPDGAAHTSLQGNPNGGLTLVVETGDTETLTGAVTGLLVAHGPEPFALMEAAATSVAGFLKTGKLRVEKETPHWVNQFGWCTWDAFYQDVSLAKVREGLESFRALGIAPRFLILDDGWQPLTDAADPTQRKKRLTGFAANDKFPGDLAPTVRMAKDEFGIETFMVWHAVGGYWAGVDNAGLPGYGATNTPRRYSDSISEYAPDLIKWFEPDCDVVPPEHIYRFYMDYHRHLRHQGVDGVKIDNQASLEGLGEGLGGRVRMMQAYHEALEGSAAVHLGGNVINCMSCASEMLYGASASNLTRTSTDFWPNKPESHGLHLYINAQVSAWFGHFVAPDWDMFQSGHEAGMYHAAGRAVGGCPVYVSDKPGAHNADVLHKLVMPDGSVPLCDRPGMPTRDCLFHDPTQEDVLLKIQNVSNGVGMIGVFHARHGEGVGPITGTVRRSDVWTDNEERDEPDESEYVVFAHHRNEMRVLGRDEPWEITLDPLTAEVFTFIPKREGARFVGIGLRDRFNSRCTASRMVGDETQASIFVYYPGSLVAWSANAPVSVSVEGEPAAFTYDPAIGRLDIDATRPDAKHVRVTFA